MYELLGSKYFKNKNGRRHWSKQRFGVYLQSAIHF